MKLEKLSETQIRCTLTKEDLADRQLHISELAYGTDKAKALFRDMMQQASYQFGFEAEDIPLMIEAIPLSKESLVLVITKVESPDELDTRFSKFSSVGIDEDYDYDDDEDFIPFEDDLDTPFNNSTNLLDDFKKLEDSKQDNASDTNEFTSLKDMLTLEGNTHDAIKDFNKKSTPIDLIRIFSIDQLSDVIELASIIVPFYNGDNSLYKNPSTNRYHLVLHKSKHTLDDFSKVCNTLSEYATPEPIHYATLANYKEHFELIILEKALQKLFVL